MAAAYAPLQQPGTCFIIIPFRKEYDRLTELIKLSAVDPYLRLEPVRSDDLGPGLPFPDVIVDQIREATMVVAVCSPEEDNKPNSNVLFELGLARAFHRPAVILTTDPATIPSDFRHITCLKYSPDDLTDNAFIKTLTLAMVKIRPVGPGAPGSAPVSKPLPATVSQTKEFWECFYRVVKATNQARKALKALEAPVNELLELALDMLKGQPSVTFISSWTRLRGLESKKDAIEKLIHGMDQWRDHCPTLLASPSVRMKEHMVIVQSQINALPSDCQAVESAQAELVGRLDDPGRMQAVYAKLLSMRDAITRLDEELHILLFTMLEEIP